MLIPVACIPEYLLKISVLQVPLQENFQTLDVTQYIQDKLFHFLFIHIW